MTEKKRVLVVSCDADVIARTVDRLPAGRLIRVVGTVGEAMAMLFGEGWGELPSLVLVDEQLPDGSGAKLLRRLKADTWLRGATLAVSVSAVAPPVEAHVAEDYPAQAMSVAAAR
jgi:CheY-like chemotaxis protein